VRRIEWSTLREDSFELRIRFRLRGFLPGSRCSIRADQIAPRIADHRDQTGLEGQWSAEDLAESLQSDTVDSIARRLEGRCSIQLSYGRTYDGNVSVALTYATLSIWRGVKPGALRGVCTTTAPPLKFPHHIRHNELVGVQIPCGLRKRRVAVHFLTPVEPPDFLRGRPTR
jgi:hypothetical protein